MKTASRILIVLSLFVFAIALAATEKATVGDLLKDSKFDNKTVVVTGVVKSFKQKTSRAGNKYFTFKIEDKKETINVYGQGELEKAPKDGDKVEATGKFEKEHKLQDFVIKNQLDVTKKGEKSENGVKILADK